MIISSSILRFEFIMWICWHPCISASPSDVIYQLFWLSVRGFGQFQEYKSFPVPSDFTYPWRKDLDSLYALCSWWENSNLMHWRFKSFPCNAVYIGIDGGISRKIHLINPLKLTGHVMHHQFNHSTTVRSAHTVFMCFVFIWEETATCAT
jgi:hypothetical protein